MSDWKAKRFWKNAHVVAVDGGFAVHLDERAVRTPAKAPLIVPTHAMATQIAVEWDAQVEAIDAKTMPVTRSANAAIDKVTPQFSEVAALITEYGGSDLLCYRADGPDTLVQSQNTAWNPMLEWAKKDLGVHLDVTTGIVPIAQSQAAMTKLANYVSAFSAFELTALHDLVSLSGSLILGLRATRNIDPPEALWATSRIDEDWQISQWGEDEDATAIALAKKSDFLAAVRFLNLSKN